MDTLETILSTVLIDGLQLSHRKFLLALVRAMLLTLSINLVRLARAAFSDAKTLSTASSICSAMKTRCSSLYTTQNSLSYLGNR